MVFLVFSVVLGENFVIVKGVFMDKNLVSNVVNQIFMDCLSSLKSGIELDMQFYLFFSDGYWKCPSQGFDKQELYAVVNLLLDHFKPEAYSLISDTYLRDAVSNDIVGEQLMACVVSPGGVQQVVVRPYEREKNGTIKIKDEVPQNEFIRFEGAATQLFEGSFVQMEDVSKAEFISRVKPLIESQKVKYKDFDYFNGKMPKGSEGNGSTPSGSKFH